MVQFEIAVKLPDCVETPHPLIDEYAYLVLVAPDMGDAKE